MILPSAHLDLSEFPTRPTQLLSARAGWAPVNFREVVHAHELLASLAWRDIRARYKQTVMGLVWVVFQPLLAAGIFSFVLTMVADMKAPSGSPYFLFTFTGLLAFNVFNNVLSRSSGVLVANAVLVSKVYFPRLVLPISSVATTLFDFCVVLVLGVALVTAFWSVPGWPILMLPVCVLVMVSLSLGLGLIGAAVAVRQRDVLYMLPVVGQFLMWGSAVFYPASSLPEKYQVALHLNPLVSVIEVFRWSMLGVGEVHWGFFAYSAACGGVLMIIGLFAFRRMERMFADVI